MRMAEVHALAKKLGVKTFGLTKTAAIRRIQRAEGNFDCFGTAVGGYCDQDTCLFYRDCMTASTARK